MSEFVFCESLSESLIFEKQGFCSEVTDYSKFDYPYIIRSIKDEIWGVRNQTLKEIDGKHYLMFKNFQTQKTKKVYYSKNINSIKGFDISGNKLFISLGQYQIMCTMNNDFFTSDTLVANKIESYSTFESFYQKDFCFINDTLFFLMADAGLVYKTNRKSGVVLKYIDKDNELSEDYFIPNLSGLYFSLIEPNDYCDINQNYYLIADADKYYIRLLDRNLNTKYEIQKKWNKNSYITKTLQDSIDSSINYYTQNSRRIMNDTKPLLGKINIIRKVGFLADSSIIVCYMEPKGGDVFDNDYKYDIWIFKDSSWILLYEDLSNYIPSEKGIISNKKIPFYSQFQILKNYIFIHSRVPILLNGEMRYDDYQKIEDQYYLENSSPFGYFIFKFKCK